MSNNLSEGFIDLHTHTTASDGSHRPAELVRMAKRSGLSAVAITDHDTLDGIEEAVEAGKHVNIEVVPGIEISGKYSHSTVHILGYFIEYNNPDLQAKINYLKNVRNRRNELMIKKFQEHGIDIKMEDLLKEAVGGLIARPHFAQVLYKKNIVKSIQEAFDRFLRNDSPTNVEKVRLSPGEIIEIIRKYRGVAVLAHPITVYEDFGDQTHRIIKELVGLGLQGIEVYYSSHTPENVAEFLEYAREFDLLITGGSDFHGHSKSEFMLGEGKGNLKLPMSILEDMKKFLRSQGRRDI